MNAGKKRKLLLPEELAHLHLLRKLGVPLTQAMAKTKLEGLISRPAVAKLIKIYDDLPEASMHTSNEHVMISMSLFPEWFGTETQGPVQEPPDDWVYVGSFPLGEWQKVVAQ